MRRAEAATIASSVAFLGVLLAECAMDGGADSPLRVTLFAMIGYATLAYPIRPALGIVIGAVVGYVVLAVASGDETSTVLVMVVALCSLGAVGVRSTYREARRRRELNERGDSLEDSERRFSAGFERSPIGVATMTVDGRYVEVNDALCRMLGRSRQWLLEHTYRDVTPPEDVVADDRTVRRIVEGDLDYAQHEKRYLRADGEIIHALVGDAVIRDADGAIGWLYVHVIDITAQHDATDRAERRTRQQSAIAAVGQRALEGVPVARLLSDSVDAMCATLDVAFAQAIELLPEGRLYAHAAHGWSRATSGRRPALLAQRLHRPHGRARARPPTSTTRSASTRSSCTSSAWPAPCASRFLLRVVASGAC